MDSQKQLKLCRFPQRTCKLMRLKVVIWILIAARSWQWAVVARNKHNFKFISFNAGTVKEYTVTWIIFILPPWRGSIIRYGRNREFTFILSVNSRLYGALIHDYSIHESTLIQCVNLRLFDAWMHVCTKRQLSLVRMWSHARGFRGSCVFKSCYLAWPEYCLQPQPTATTGLRLKFISQLLIALICMCAAETYTILIVFGYPYHSFSFKLRQYYICEFLTVYCIV